MPDLYLNPSADDGARRALVFEGKILLYSSSAGSLALCEHALNCAQRAFETSAPELAFRSLAPADFAKKAEVAKREFTNGQRSKELLRSLAREMGYDADKYYFDVPRLRIVPTYEYLHAGVSYAYLAHRDTWYGGPTYQINHWMPVLPITPDRTMSLYPAYFKRPVRNTSKDFNLTRWVNVERAKAVANIAKEERQHPVPVEDIDAAAEIRIAPNKGDMMVFSGTHLHATVPNHSNVTRFSVDFRFFHVDDVAAKGALRAPENVDSEAITEDYGMRDCFRLNDFTPFRSNPS